MECDDLPVRSEEADQTRAQHVGCLWLQRLLRIGGGYARRQGNSKADHETARRRYSENVA